MISITMTPPKNLNAPKPSLYDAYNYMMQGDFALGRATMAQFYNGGIENPRARMYESKLEIRNMLEAGRAGVIQAPRALKPELRTKHNTIMNEIIDPKHSMVTATRERLLESFKQFYPTKKTQIYSKFIMNAKVVPFINKFKFLLKLL